MIKKIHFIFEERGQENTAVKKSMRKQNTQKKIMIKETKAKMCSDGDAKMQLFLNKL